MGRTRVSEHEVLAVRHLVRASLLELSGPEELCIDSVDWQGVLAIARRHRLGPLLRQGLGITGLDAAVPPRVNLALQNDYNVHLAIGILQAHHVDELAVESRRHGLRFSLLKGAAFSRTLYRHAALRPMADIDILVPDESLEGWAGPLAALGYRHFDTTDHAVCFRRESSGVMLKLHRSLTSCPGFLGLDTEALLARSIPAGEEDPHVLSLGPADHLIHLCLHASFQHGFRQAAINAWDAVLLCERGRLDVDTFLRAARDERLARWVYAGLTMCQTAFPHPLLAELTRSLSASVSRRVQRRVERLEPADALAPEPEATFGTPWMRLFWAKNLLELVSLLWESSKPRFPESSRLERTLGLLVRHGSPAGKKLLSSKLSPFARSRSVYLGEVRDV